MNVETKAWHVLLVDDDPLVIKVYAERMRHQGWRVAIARDGWEACQEARRTKYDMILLDIRMPYHDGMEVLSDIRSGELNKDTQVHLLTSLMEGDDIVEAIGLGANGVFHKSTTRPDELVAEIERKMLVNGTGDDKVAQEAEAFVTAGTELLVPRGEDSQEIGNLSVAEIENAREMAFDVFVNPFLGNAKALAELLGYGSAFMCPTCAGQLCLRLTPNPLGNTNDLTGYFYCNECGAEL